MISSEQRQFERWELTAEGEAMVQHGSHEARLFNAVDPQNGSLQAELMVCVCVCVHVGSAMSCIRQLECLVVNLCSN